MKTAKEYLAAQMSGHPAAPFISYSDALAAVQAVIDHYEPIPGLELVYRVIEPAPPTLHNVFPAACPRCTQRLDHCLCPPLFPREEPPF